jgi:hypothetical protein
VRGLIAGNVYDSEEILLNKRFVSYDILTLKMFDALL